MIDINKIMFGLEQKSSIDPTMAWEKAEAIVRAKGAVLAAGAIGRSLTVKTGPKTSIMGIITECNVAGVKRAGKFGDQVQAIFAVTMKCGKNEVIRQFNVGKVPG